ncbi:MAG: M14 family zinc carboxypeptidase [Armatimonadota bacterium]
MECAQSNRRSVLGQTIELYVFGDGPETIMFLAGVHGDEKNGVSVACELVERLAGMGDASLEGVRFLVMPLANPDGYELGTRKNARGIDINRNFPTRDFGTGERDPEHKFYGGMTPASEPETRAIMEVVESYRPQLIISLHEPMSCVNYNGPSARLARRISKLTGLPVVSDIGYPCPGSMGTYYGKERRVPMITLELPDGRLNALDWADLLLDVVGAGNSVYTGAISQDLCSTDTI